MRERFLEAFDAVRIDCLNGDRYKTGKVAPDGSPDPSVFSTEDNPVGIQVGTAIATLVRKPDHAPADRVAFRHLWGQSKPAQLTATAESEPDSLYDGFAPILPFGLPFMRMPVSENWFDWPSLPDLFPASFPGVKTSRDPFLVDTDLDALKRRVEDYFNPDLSHAEIARRYPAAMRRTARFNAQQVRDTLLARGGPSEDGFIRYEYRPFDTRWLYWEADTKLLDEKRAEYKSHVFVGNLWLSSAQHLRKGETEPQTYVTKHLGSLHMIERGALWFPAYLRDDALFGAGDESELRPNLSPAAQAYLGRIGAEVEDLFHHVLAVLHDPAYRESNAGALRMEWPRIPLPGWPDASEAVAAEALAQSAARGREIARLLDTESDVPGVTSGPLRPEIAAIAVPATSDNRNMAGDDFNLDAGWGHFGANQAVMPGQGRATQRDYTPRRTRRPLQRHIRPGRLHPRHPPKRPRLLEKHPRQRLELQTRRLPGPQEMALLPRPAGSGPRAEAGGSPPLHQHRPPHRRPAAGGEQMRILKSINFWGALSVVVTLAVGITIAIVFWGWFREGPTNVESNGATIRNIGLLIGGAVALVFGIWRTVVAHQQLNVAQRGLLNDRYQKGAEMLSNNSLAVRLGGIYALRNLAQESPEQYHVQVIRLLCAFVRHPFNGESTRFSIPREDTQAAMDVIGSRNQTLIEFEETENFVPNLSGITGLTLEYANLSGAVLANVNLSGSVLSDANLSDSVLSNANLSSARLQGVKGLIQDQLDEAVADPDNPPILDGVLDADGNQLIWRGGVPEDDQP